MNTNNEELFNEKEFETAMEINGSEMSEKISAAISEGTKGEAILQQILFQYGADQS